MPLFERLSRGLKLTEAGEVFAHHVVTVLQDEERLTIELDALKGDYRGEIRLMSVEGLCAGLVAPVIMEMIQRYPNVKIVVKNGTSMQNAKAVVEGDADLALSFASEHSADLRRCYLGRFGLGAIMQPDHPLASKNHLSFAECAAYPLILNSPELTISQEMKPLITTHSQPLTVLLETASIELAKSIAILGLGIAFQTRLGLEREIDDGRLAFIPLKTSPCVFSELSVYVRSGRSLLPALDAFVNLLTEEIHRREALEGPNRPENNTVFRRARNVNSMQKKRSFK